MTDESKSILFLLEYYADISLALRQLRFRRHHSVTARQGGRAAPRKRRCRSCDLRAGVVGDGFSDVEGGIFAALATASPSKGRTCRSSALCLDGCLPTNHANNPKEGSRLITKKLRVDSLVSRAGS